MNSTNINLLQQALTRNNTHRPPCWFMRQAGRYHSHYQNLRVKHSFMQLCKEPELACQVTLGPIEEFDFDAAILFSDILFPLEALGMGLHYDPAPRCDWYFNSMDDIKKFKENSSTNITGNIASNNTENTTNNMTDNFTEFFSFQSRALNQIRSHLPKDKGLLGFVGGPLTLFSYASENSTKGIYDGRFDAFCEELHPILLQNMLIQAEENIDAIAIFDTSAGELDPVTYQNKVVPHLTKLLNEFRGQSKNSKKSDLPIIYYSLGTSEYHWDQLTNLPIDCLGVDWRHDISSVLRNYHDKWAIQGNIPPYWLTLNKENLAKLAHNYFNQLQNLPNEYLKGWICGLGHGVTPKASQDNVKFLVSLQKEVFNDTN